MKICVITPDYPDKKRPVYSFVKQLVDAFSTIDGVSCQVVAPFSVVKNKSIRQFDELPCSENVKIFRPRKFSLSKLRIFGWNVSSYFNKKAVLRQVKHLSIKPDVIYCHFWISAVPVIEYAKKNNIPLFVATGESDIKKVSHEAITCSKLPTIVKGVVCVSTKNKNESIELGLTSDTKCIVIPNAVDPTRFYHIDKQKCRKELGYPLDVFIVAFVGSFKESKGPYRVVDAINNTSDIYSIFIGSGVQDPVCKNNLFKGKLPHSEIVKYLNAADVFVLPTQAEGCCNAVIEAMACGLPIISSNLPFNWDVLDDSNSIMVDPNNIDEIRTAIIKLRDDADLRNRLSVGALNRAKSLVIEERAKSIIDFICEKIKK